MSKTVGTALSRTGYNVRKCPACGGETGITRTMPDGRGYLTRYRVCKQCKWRGRTVELLMGKLPPGRSKETPLVILRLKQREAEHEQGISDRQPDAGPRAAHDAER